MAVTGIWSEGLSGGTINTSYSYHLTKNISPSANIWATCMLQYVGETSDETTAQVWVDGYTESGTYHDVHYSSVFANPCSKVKFGLYVDDCMVDANCVIFYF
jgi:hypothetical protein